MIAGKLAKYIIRSVLLVIIVAVISGSLPAPAQAAENIDLVLTGEGSISWNLENVKPGDSGTKTVNLRNDSDSDCLITIWVSDVNSGEGINYESETGNLAEPGELDNYLWFDASCPQLTTNLPLPALIHDLPQSAIDPNYMVIRPLGPQETATLLWEWDFLNTAEPQNDAQGDTLSFTLNYQLAELPLPIQDDNNYYVPVKYQDIEVDVLGNVFMESVSDAGYLSHSLVSTSSDGWQMLEINQGTWILGNSGGAVDKIEMSVNPEPRQPPDGFTIVGPVYDITGYVGQVAQDSISFNPPAKLTLHYNPEWLTEENSWVLSIAWYDAEHGWTYCTPFNSTGKPGEISAYIGHASTFTILGKSPAAVTEVKEIILPPVTPPPVTPSVITPPGQDTLDNQPVAIGETSSMEAPRPPVPAKDTSGLKEFLQWASLAVAIIGILIMAVLGSIQRRRRAYQL